MLFKLFILSRLLYSHTLYVKLGSGIRWNIFNQGSPYLWGTKVLSSYFCFLKSLIETVYFSVKMRLAKISDSFTSDSKYTKSVYTSSLLLRDSSYWACFIDSYKWVYFLNWKTYYIACRIHKFKKMRIPQGKTSITRVESLSALIFIVLWFYLIKQTVKM